MSVLHIINKSPFTDSAMNSCSLVCAKDDAVLLIEDGVYGALAIHPRNDLVVSILDRKVHLYVLEADAIARGIGDRVAPHVQLIDYGDFVKLTVQHQCVQSWY